MASFDAKEFLKDPVQRLKAASLAAVGGDPKAFLQSSAQEIYGSMKPAVQLAVLDVQEVHGDLAGLQEDVDKTLEALARETVPSRIAGLKEDLERALASRRASILLKARAKLASDAHAALDAALATFVKIAVAVARAFVPALGAV